MKLSRKTMNKIDYNKDYTGQKFNMLTAISFSHKSKFMAYWNCQCDCGSLINTQIYRVVNGYTKSCGCYQRAAASNANRKHGESQTAREYHIWNAMKKRCFGKSNKAYHLYGGRGITVCERWVIYENFLSDMGRAPSPKHSLDRKDNNGNYEPNNCRWATPIEQANNRRHNRRIEMNGITMTIAEWCRHYKVARPDVVYNRLRYKNWTLERAINQPLKHETKI